MSSVRSGTPGEADAAARAAVKPAELTRRTFIQRSAGLGVAGLIPGVLAGMMGSMLSACSDATDPTKKTTIDLRTEPGVLNFVYAILQLEADFYLRIARNKFPGMLVSESSTFTNWRFSVSDARDDLMNTKIPTGRITDVLLFRLGLLIDYSERTSVVTAAQTLADGAARGFLAATSLVHTDATVELITSLSDAAALRAADMRNIAGSPPLTVTPQPPQEVMTELAPYFYTTLTVRS